MAGYAGTDQAIVVSRQKHHVLAAADQELGSMEDVVFNRETPVIERAMAGGI